jgi:hypothetical protein
MNRTILAAAILATAPIQAQQSVADYQKQAVEMYPDIGRAGSDLNRRFVDEVAAARLARPELFQKTDWPLLLAKEVGGPSKPTSTAGASVSSNPTGQRIAEREANPSTDAVMNLELVLQSKNVPGIITTLEVFSHSNALFRAQAASLKEQWVDAQKATVDAQNWNQKAAFEIARIRKNAKVSARPNPLITDGSNLKRAQEQENKADALEDEGQRMLANTAQRTEELTQSVSKFIVAVREADARERQRLMAKTNEEESKRLALEKLKRTQEFFTSLDEPEGKPEFADENAKPSYTETIDFINAKLHHNQWRLRYGTRSNQFILVHPNGAYFFRPRSLSPVVKSEATGDLHFVKLEVSDPKSSIKVVAREAAAQPDLRKIAIPSADRVDSEKLAKAFGHLITMAGAKADPF